MNWFDRLKRRAVVGGNRFVDVGGFHLLREIESLRALPRYADPLNLVPSGGKMYSQNDEDGFLVEIFRRIETTSKVFIEFGAGDGLENNTCALLFQDWTGLWIDGSEKLVRRIRKGLPGTIASGQLSVQCAMINPDNINDLISKGIKTNEVDLLSIDIDGNDLYVFEAISCVQARVVVMEYNAKFLPPVRYCMAYDPNHRWDYTDHFGASLKTLEETLAARDYALVGCSLSGANAFFVKRELAEGKFEAPFTAEKHFEPSRPYLAKLRSGHPPGFKTLEQRRPTPD